MLNCSVMPQDVEVGGYVLLWFGSSSPRPRFVLVTGTSSPSGAVSHDLTDAGGAMHTHLAV